MGELSDLLQRRLDAWREAQKAKPTISPKRPEKQKNFVSRKEYGDEDQIIRGQDDNR